MMVHFGKFIAKHRSLIFLLSLLLLIPSALGYIATRINYDVLSYLPDTLETVAGQDILVDEFGMGAFSMVIVENMEHQDVVRLEETIEGIDHVKDVLWYDDILDISVPEMMLPSDLKDALFTENSTMMIALFDQTTSADETMDAISTMRAEVGKECFISGMSGIVTDIKNLALKEMPVYVLIASLLSMLVLMLTLESAFVPVLFLTSIGMAVIFNLGSTTAGLDIQVEPIQDMGAGSIILSQGAGSHKATFLEKASAGDTFSLLASSRECLRNGAATKKDGFFQYSAAGDSKHPITLEKGKSAKLYIEFQEMQDGGDVL